MPPVTPPPVDRPPADPRAWTGGGAYAMEGFGGYDEPWEREQREAAEALAALRDEGFAAAWAPADEAARGLVIGRFCPPHLGHQLLLDVARAHCREVVVVVAAWPEEPIPAATRRAWLAEMAPGARIEVVESPVQGLEVHNARAADWAARLRARLGGPPDRLFASEPGHRALAHRLGCELVLVDPQRTIHPISASRIREDPMGTWRHLPAPVRPHYVRRVRVVGAESTGNRTLAHDLAGHYGTAAVPDYLRLHALAGRAFRRADVLPVARTVRAAEAAAARHAQRVLITDGGAADLHAWCLRRFGEAPPWLDAEVAARAPDLTLLLAADVPFVGPPAHDDPAGRAAHDAGLRARLRAGGGTVVELTGAWEERWGAACRAVDELIGTSSGC